MRILVRDGKCDRAYLAEKTLGFEKVEREILPRFTPAYVDEITGIPESDIERFASLYGGTKKSFLRIGEGIKRVLIGDHALLPVAVVAVDNGAMCVDGRDA